MIVIVYKCASSLKWALEVDGAWDMEYYDTARKALNAAKRKYPHATIKRCADLP